MSRELSASALATAVMAIVATVGLIAPSTAPSMVIVAVCFFTVGVVAMAWAFLVGVNRSRHEAVSMYGLFLGVEGVLPNRLRRRHLALIGLQILIGVGGGLGGGEPLAFGVLIVQLGFGLLALDAARNGTFPAPN